MQERQQLTLLSDWSAQIRDESRRTSGFVDVRPDQSKQVHSIVVDEVAEVEEPKVPEWQIVNGIEVLGQLKIDRIDLVQPIVRGISETALLQGVGTVVDERLPGQTGNFVLAGHRGWSHGRLFNRLGEVEIGDQIEIDTTAGAIGYEVVSTKLVLPDELSVLDNEADMSTLTLITCHPKRNPTHRLIVKAVLKDSSDTIDTNITSKAVNL